MPNCSVSGTKARLQTWGGTRPGYPVADCLFAVTFACMQKSLRRKIASKGLETVFVVDPTNLLCPSFSGEVPFVGPAFLDDFVLFVRSSAASVLGHVAEITSLTAAEASLFGFRLNTKVGKRR